jgi:hypothetical protein
MIRLMQPRAVAVLAGVAGLFISTVFAQKDVLPENMERLRLVGVKAERVTYRGRQAVRVVEPEVNAGGGIAIVPGVEFRDGTIDVQLAGQPIAGAAEGSRGFVGIAFRVQRDPGTHECFYLRPTNGRADDQLRRNHSAQYVSHPDFPWPRLRKETPGVYESYVDLEPGAWTPVRIVVQGAKAQLYVHNAAQPALIVNDLKLGAGASGSVALWIGPGTEAHFANLAITPG